MSTVQEQAPSETRAEAPTVSRYLFGFGGLFLVTLGVASVVAAGYGRGFFGEWGYLFAAVGTALLLFHALRDGDLEIRRAYGALGGLLLLLAVGVGIYPAAPPGGTEAVAGQLLLPWGALFGLVALLFIVAFARHETEEPLRSWAHMALLGTGGLLAAGTLLVGITWPELMAGPGGVFAVLAVAYLCGYFAVTNQSDDLPHWAGVGLGVLGGVAVTYALFRTLGPEVLSRGPDALRNPNQTLNGWSVGGRVLLILLGLGGLLAVRVKRWPLAVRLGVAAVGLAFAGLYAVGSFARPVTDTPGAYLVPGGLLLGASGVLFLAVAVGVTADAPLVVLVRRELAAFFYSPIAYVVLFGNALVGGVLYLFFLGQLGVGGVVLGRTADEPIVAQYWAFTIGAAFTAPIMAAVITMRLFSEEKRTGTLEVLLTAPVNDWAVVLSKFTAALGFFLACWVPAGVYLLALRYVGGTPFDYRPLLSYALALTACGCSFVGFGMFVSSLTRNQIMAAVITFAGLFAMFLTYLRNTFPNLDEGVKAALGKVDYLSLWYRALLGQLPVSEACVQLSLGVLWVFLTAKVLEARKWS